VAGTTTNGSLAYATILRNFTDTALQFATNNIVRATITSGGNVGIGLTPASKLDILQELRVSFADANQYRIRITNTDGNGRIFVDGSQSSLLFGTSPSGTGQTAIERMRITDLGNIELTNGSIGNDSGGKNISIFGSSGSSAASLSLIQIWNGNAYPGKIIVSADPAAGAASSRLQFQTSYFSGGIITATGLTINYESSINFNGYTSNGTLSTSGGTGRITVSSDKNMKIDAGFVENGIDKVMSLKPRYFYWKDENTFGNKKQLGFYAQEVNEVSEEASNTPEEGQGWGIYDRALVALLTKAIQEQQAQIEELKALIAAK
jgi:hypothetical protein